MATKKKVVKKAPARKIEDTYTAAHPLDMATYETIDEALADWYNDSEGEVWVWKLVKKMRKTVVFSEVE